MNVGRNDPCPCGSGKKYKKCHLDEDAAAERAALAAQALAAAESGDDGETPASFEEFARSVLSTAGDSPEETAKLRDVASVFWNVARMDRKVRERTVMETAMQLPVDERQSFVSLASSMIEKYDAMQADKREARLAMAKVSTSANARAEEPSKA